MNKPKIVILGARYGGIITSKTLQKLLKSDEADLTAFEYHHKGSVASMDFRLESVKSVLSVYLG